MTDHPGEQFPPAVDPDVEPGHAPEPDESSEPDYDAEPGPDSRYEPDRPSAWVNPTLQGRPHTDPLLAGFTVYGDPTPEPEEDTEQAFEASLEEPTRHSFVDDGPEDSYDEPADEVEPAPAPTPAPVVPAPGAAFPRPGTPSPPTPSPGQTHSRPDAQSASRAGVPMPAQSFPRQAAPTQATAAQGAPAQTFPRPAAPTQTYPRPVAPAGDRAESAAPSQVFPQSAASVGSAPASPRPGAPAQAPASPASVVRGAEAGGEDGVHPLVEETMARLDELRERPVAEHAEVYADLHERLQSALVEADAEHGDRG